MSSDLREFVRSTDDTEFTKIALADSPRFRVVDLYVPLSDARRKAPVHMASQTNLLGQADYRTQEEFQKVNFVSVLSYEHCAAALSDPRLSSKFWEMVIGPVWGRTIIGMDGQDHRRHRGLISQAFTRKALMRWEDAVIKPAVNGLIDRFAERGSVDLYSEFTLLFPVYVITELLGLPPGDIQRFNGWAAETISAFYDMERALDASRNLEAYLTPIIEERRERPGDDLISLLAAAELDGSRLDTLEVVSFLRLLLPAGGETTARSTSSLLLGLLRNPAQLERVVADRGLLPQAVEEGLRWEPPLASINRTATEDMELDGVPVPQGTVVECALGMANRDETRWEDPHRFDIDRKRQPHLAFAWGPHTCIGAHLARLEMKVALDVLFDRLPGLRLDSAADPEPVVRGIGLRSPNHVPALFDA